jgi:hypothetical protein
MYVGITIAVPQTHKLAFHHPSPFFDRFARPPEHVTSIFIRKKEVYNEMKARCTAAH